MAGTSKTTTNHDEIKKWVEERQGKPATVQRTESGDEPGVLRIDFPGYSGAGSLVEISWDEFFQKFDEKNLAFLYQDTTSSGEESRFFKFVSRDTAEHKEHASHSSHSSSKTESKAHKDDEKSHKTEHKAEHKTEGKSHKAEHKADEKEHNEHKATSKSHK